ncbi:hypothetical protein [Aquimarina brevivitae]|uniref:Secreted protein n=1 Tax=Aquimarina brevivitae TaxID=323412 RepID=A0A4Q7PEJ0_9FLAO|nr:hypothetical protein [Aquimarina brevivitae]RZS98841.1 hypothetical protein EV197_0041 [Aquimarina brevivitae]
MRNSYVSSLIIMLFVCLQSTAQLSQSIARPIQKPSAFNDYDGSVYERVAFRKAEISDKQHGTHIAELRYNIHTDALEYENDNGYFELYKRTTLNVRFDDEYFYYCKFKNERGADREGYYVLIEKHENYSIYKKYDLEFREPKRVTMTQVEESGKINQVITYYLEERGVITELPMRKKDFLAIFRDKETELEDYMKEERIRLRKEEDLIRIVSRYHALKNIDGDISNGLLTNRNGID